MSEQHQQCPAHLQKIITVFGATGKQGTSVINALLKENKYKIRGIARSRDQKDAEKFNHLKEKGVEMFKANVTTLEGIDEALKGAHIVFLTLASFDTEVEGHESEIGRKLVDKAKANGVKVLIWSTAPHAQKISGGKYHVPHFTEKAKVEEYIRNIQKGKDAFESAVFIAPSFYYQNFQWKAFAPKKDTSGTFEFVFPKTKTLTACDINDLGHLLVKILQNPREYNNKTLFLEGEQTSPENFVKKFEEVTRQKAVLKEVSREEWEKNPNLNHGKQLAEMFAFKDEFDYFGQEKEKAQSQVIHAREIFPVKSWEAFLHETGWKGEHP